MGAKYNVNCPIKESGIAEKVEIKTFQMLSRHISLNTLWNHHCSLGINFLWVTLTQKFTFPQIFNKELNESICIVMKQTCYAKNYVP